jgi:hypothetical protein
VHENHTCAPLLALAAAVRPRLRAIHVAVSTVVALNLFLFSDSDAACRFHRAISTIIDATAILAAANCAIFVWHLRVFKSIATRSIAD